MDFWLSAVLQYKNKLDRDLFSHGVIVLLDVCVHLALLNVV